MKLPQKIKMKYQCKLDELIQRGRALPIEQKSEISSIDMHGQKRYRYYNVINWPAFVEWRTSCSTVLDQIIPKSSVHRATVDNLSSLKNNPDQLEFCVSFLQSIKTDLETGFFDAIASEIEAEIAADYMSQAENLLNPEMSGRFDHIPAAVLSGAVLEKALKTICNQLSPAEPVKNDKGAFLTLNPLIDKLKKRNVFNELMAKQLRAWADIRNHAAHGNFDEFTKDQVKNMVSGIGSFLAQYL